LFNIKAYYLRLNNETVETTKHQSNGAQV